MMRNNTPKKINLHKQSKTLEIQFANDTYQLPAELLRVYSPSAEVQGHGPGQEVLVAGKIDVGITALEPSGNYGIRITFDDGHDTGIFTWTYLAELGKNQDSMWETYLQKLKDDDQSRDPHTTPLFFSPS